MNKVWVLAAVATLLVLVFSILALIIEPRACKQSGFACYLGDVDVVRVVLGRSDHERNALIKLDPCQGGDPHVQEDAKENSQRDEAQHVSHHYGHT